MRVVLTALGTAGDVQPTIALAEELRRHGHQPVFALPFELLPYARRYGFEAIQIGPNLREITIQNLKGLSQGQQTTEVYNQAMFAAAPQVIQELRSICEKADVLVATDYMRVSRIVHELTGIAFVSLCVSFPRFSVWPANDRERYVLNKCHKHFNSLRVQVGLPPLPASERHNVSPQLSLLAQSHVLLPPDYQLAYDYIVGNIFMDEEDWQPDPALTAFLQAGPPPIVIDLGSMVHDNSLHLSQLFLDAIQLVGCRALIQSGWTDLAQGIFLPKNIHRIDFVPYSWLFPKASCLVYHGGAGTTAAALCAGLPTVAIPHAFDHFAVSQRIQDLGCVSAILSLQELSADRLSVAIRDALTNPAYRAASEKAGEQIKSEHGAITAVMHIEQFIETIK